MNSLERPLAGSVIGLSISESEDSTARGFPSWQINRVTLQLTIAFFGQGVGVAFGHDWRENGVMEAVHGFAQQVQSPMPLSLGEAEATGQPLLINLLPWPDTPRLRKIERERLASTLRVQSVGLPDELVSYAATAVKDLKAPVYRYLRARALTYLRHQLNAICDAQLCLGGRTSGFAGRYPGVIEEAFLAVQNQTPLYLAGSIGGATKQVIDAIKGEKLRNDFCPPNEVSRLYETPPVREGQETSNPDRKIDREAVWFTFKNGGIKPIAKANRLTPEENEELFCTPSLDRVIQLVLVGLSRLKSKQR